MRMPFLGVMYSLRPHARAPIAGTPHAMAFTITKLWVSAVLIITNISLALYASASASFVGRKPRNLI